VTTTVLQITLLVVLLVLSSIFSGSETALFSLKPYQVRKLQRRPSRTSITVASLLNDPYHLLVTILVGNTLVNVAASSIGTDVVGRFFEEGVLGISVAVMTVLILIFGEIVPKTMAVRNPVGVSLRTAGVISGTVRVLSPLKGALESVVSVAGRLRIGRPPAVAHRYHDHVAEAIAVGHSEGVLDRFEGEMLRGIFRIMHLSVQNIMTPRIEVFMVASNVTVREAVGKAKASGYSRIPVFDEEKRDNIRGVLYAKDLLQRQYSSDLRVGEIARKPVFVPESKALSDLLREFVSGAAHFAVVIDEHGSFTGIVTLDDILEEIVGLEGDRHREKYFYRRKGRLTWEVAGRMELEFFNALIGASIPVERVETIAGFVIERMGKIPAVGEELTAYNLRFRVLEADHRRISRLEVRKHRKYGK
jgi:CBS domain containing-hemolysin-like protein